MAEVEPAQIPLPTHSMVTVRLSDANLQSEPFPDLDEEQDNQVASSSSERTSSSSSRRSSSSSATNSVNWEGLEKTEEQEPRDEGTDESTALLLARLEQENNALAHDPKSGLATNQSRCETKARPPSLHYLKKLVNGPQRQSLRYSLLPPPPMTELEFWAALVKDYRQTCQRLPNLTSKKIRGGVPPPLRGVVWPAIAGAQDSHLYSEYQRLSNQISPYDGLIGKDVGRSFPNVDMFRQKDGEGQRMLGRVLKAFSLYDDKIGYCQGLGFVVGPLLMHMSETEAFCVLVRLMDHYDLRSCYTPDLSGLHLRIYQFQTLMSRHLPDLAAHLLHLKIEPIYISQWFLSFFAVTCPLPMLLRIYDVILSEGAVETLMRVALSLMQRNEKKLLAFTEFEDAMQFLLSRSLWDTYAQRQDDLITDFTSLTGLVSGESLQLLENDYQQSQVVPSTSILKSAATSILGRFWTGASHKGSKSANLSLTIPNNINTTPMRKMSSAASTKSNTVSTATESTSEVSTAATETSDAPRTKSDDLSIILVDAVSPNANLKDKDLHNQIEELLTALNKLQHQQIELARDLQREREERAEERDIAASLLGHLQKEQKAIRDLVGSEDVSAEEVEIEELTARALVTFADQSSRRQSTLLSKHQLREDVATWKDKYDAEAARCRELMKQLDDRETEQNALKENLKDARSRVQDGQRDKQRLERTIQDLRLRSPATPDSPSDVYTPVSEIAEFKLPATKGLREFKLGRTDSMPRSPSMTSFGKRTSSLTVQSLVATENTQAVSTEALLVELVNAKTAEAVARQELEETKGKLDALRKIISGPASSPSIKAITPVDPGSTTPSTPAEKPAAEPAKPASHAPSSSIGGFFSGWGKRS